MASNVCAHRALTAGLSAGACLAIPAVAFAATIPFKDVHAVVGTAAMPFAIGSLAGMGMLAATKRLISSHEEQLDQAAEHVEAVAHRRSENVRAAHQQGVPVISRAVDALSEEEAWAEIDSLLDSDLSVSCDPIHSKDMYQIALEEIARGTASNTACESTDTFMTIPDAAVTGSSRSQEQTAARSSAVAASVASICPDPVPEELEEPEAIEVPMVDYSGHEDMWAAALAILSEGAEETRAISVGEAVPFQTAQGAETTAPVPQERCRAIAEGARSTGLHTHVNEILEEEFDKVSSQSVRTRSHEYLRVIQGGTMTMPRLVAQEA